MVLKAKFSSHVQKKPINLFVLNTHILFNLKRGEIKAS